MKFIWFLFFILAGCSEQTLIKVEEKITEGQIPPDIVVTPEFIEYGHLIAGQESLSEIVSIINAGGSVLEIDEVGIYGQSNFLITQQPIPDLEQGDLSDVVVEYTPITFEEKSASLYIISNDPDEPVVQIPIHGYGDAPVIEVNPTEVDKGVVYLGCEDVTSIEISNLGNMDLIIDNLDFWISPPNDFSIIDPILPLVIPPNSMDIIEVPYIPEDLIADAAMIDIDSNDPINPLVTVDMVASSDYAGFVTDTFEQASIRRVDILFVVDNSGSMMVFQNHLANNISSFMNAFSSLNADYQIAVITTDNFNFRGPIITNSSVDPVGDLSSQVQAGTYGSGHERGIYMSHEALQPGKDAGPGSSFLRNDSSLVIVYVSDERDGYASNWMNYASYIETVKPTKGQIVAHSVIGDFPSGCLYSNGNYSRNVMFGDGYYDIVNYFGGTNYSLCALDWGYQLQSMAFDSVPLLSYSLSSEDVIEDTIEVTIGGQLSNVWWYNADNNEININSSDAPADGEKIEITYAVTGCGE